MVFYIDGYNVIFQCKGLKNLQIESAAAKLVNQVVNFVEVSDARAVIVFDGSRPKNEEEIITSRLKIIICKKGFTADAMIEKLVVDNKDKDLIYVVTSDIEERNIAAGAGALCIKPKQFCGQMKNSMADTKQRHDENNNVYLNRLEEYFK